MRLTPMKFGCSQCNKANMRCCRNTTLSRIGSSMSPPLRYVFESGWRSKSKVVIPARAEITRPALTPPPSRRLCDRFCYDGCGQKWGREVAYGSQFATPSDRAHWGQAKIRSRLRELGSESDNWEFPPKPKEMRWSTYDRLFDQFNQYEGTIDERFYRVALKAYRCK